MSFRVELARLLQKGTDLSVLGWALDVDDINDLADFLAANGVSTLGADTVPVVRCKDCGHSVMWDDQLVCGRISDVMIGYYHGTIEVVTPDDFCSHGERREDHEQNPIGDCP